jgi:hypothetical protein
MGRDFRYLVFWLVNLCLWMLINIRVTMGTVYRQMKVLLLPSMETTKKMWTGLNCLEEALWIFGFPNEEFCDQLNNYLQLKISGTVELVGLLVSLKVSLLVVCNVCVWGRVQHLLLLSRSDSLEACPGEGRPRRNPIYGWWWWWHCDCVR